MDADTWVPLPKAWQQCLEAGHTITKQGLLSTSLAHGAVRKMAHEPVPHHWEINPQWLSSYIENALALDEEGWLKISLAANLYSIPVNTLYSWASTGLILIKRIGPGQGVIHVRESDIQRNAEHRKNGKKPTAD